MTRPSSVSDTSDLEIIMAQLVSDELVRAKVGPYLEDWMFGKDAVRAYISTIVIENREGRNPPKNIIVAKIKQAYPKLQPEDWRIIVQIMNAQKVSDSDFEAVISISNEFITDRYKMRGLNSYAKGNKIEAEQYLTKGLQFKISDDTFFDPTDDAKVLAYRNKDLPPEGNIFRSSLSLINEVSMFSGYKPGDLVLVLAPPKRGKSTWLAQEGATLASQGACVAHMALGDMSHYDVWCKYVTRLNNEFIQNVAYNPLEFLDPVRDTMSRVRIASHAALSRTIFDVLAELKDLLTTFPFKAFIIDYDSNIIPPSESMYESGGVVYSHLKGFAQSTDTVGFIASQPKMQFWNDEDIDGGSAAESSRKQHVIDYMITFGRSSITKKLGIVHLPFVRRGESMMKRYVFYEDSKCKISEITTERYRRIMAEAQAEKNSTGDITI